MRNHLHLSFKPICSAQAGGNGTAQLLGLCSDPVSEVRGQGKPSVGCGARTCRDGSDIARKAPERRETLLSWGLVPLEPPAFPTALQVHTYETFTFPSKLLLDPCLWDKLMKYVVGTEDLKRQFEKRSRSNLLPGTTAACSPCCAGPAVLAAQAVCSSLALNSLFIYKMHYLPV